MGFLDTLKKGLDKTRVGFQESVNILLERGPNLDEDFWEGLEEALILCDVGPSVSFEIVENLRDDSEKKGLPDAYAVFDYLSQEIANQFVVDKSHILDNTPAIILFVGINGTGKTTTVGKIAKENVDRGKSVILGCADTFRAAAIEQLEIWADRSNTQIITHKRGSDPASVCFDTIKAAQDNNIDLTLIDTAGRLHTSDDLMRELKKVVNVVKKIATVPVYTVLVMDATTGQNGLIQAQEFNKSLNLDALIVTKLDGSAKGGIALRISKELNLPIIKIGVGEKIDDLKDFNSLDFAKAFIGDFKKTI